MLRFPPSVNLRFLIQPLTSTLLDEVRLNHTRTTSEIKLVEGRREVVKVEDADETAIALDLIDHLVLDWEGLMGEDGEPLPCTRENKLALLEGYPALGASWVEVSRWAVSRFMEFQLRERERLEKNLSPLPSGSTAGKGISNANGT